MSESPKKPNPAAMGTEVASHRLGDYMVQSGLITRAQLEEAIEYIRNNGGLLSSLLLKHGYIDEQTIPRLLADKYDYPVMTVADESVEQRVINLLPYGIARRYMAFPVRIKDGALILAMTEPTNSSAVHEIGAIFKHPVQEHVTSQRDIVEAFRKYYKIPDDEYRSHLLDLSEEADTAPIGDLGDLGDLIAEAADGIQTEAAVVSEGGSAADAPVIKLVNQILAKAVSNNATDIHIEPFEKHVIVRFRSDGVLSKSMELPVRIRNAVTSRLKLMANLEIAGKPIPQAGRFQIKTANKRSLDFRLSSIPTLFGESLTITLLDKGALYLDAAGLGLSETDLAKFNQAIQRPSGLNLFTGPVGSGSRYTLYAALTSRNTDDVKIMTVEDPVQFHFPGIIQVNVGRESGLMSYAQVLRAFRDHDVDVYMVDAISDAETANLVVEATTTGQSVMSTLMAGDCAAAITRLGEMGLQPSRLASALNFLTSQRLVRRICPKCAEVYKADPELLAEAGFDEAEIPELELKKGRGCGNCNNTGYKGRIGVYEIMEITPRLREAIAESTPETQLRKIAVEEGMKILREDALDKCSWGITSLEQVLKHTAVQ